METKTEKAQTVKKTSETTNGKSTTTTATLKPEAKREEKTLSLAQLLEKQLSEIKRKKTLVDRRDIFLKKSTELENCLSDLREEQKSGNFTTDNYVLSFSKKGNYRDDDAFKISNPVLMEKFLVSLQSEIDLAVNGIETELMKDL